jgi:FkbM family methyltransferase
MSSGVETFPVNPWVKTFVPHLGWMFFPVGDEVCKILYQGHFEASEQALLWLYLRPGDRALDCGAHVGLYSRLMAQLVGSTGCVRSFEPDSATRQLWEANLKGISQPVAICHPFGLWSCDQNLDLVSEGEGMSSHNFVVVDGGPPNQSRHTIQVKSLDTLPEVNDGSPWHFAKIDCEGAEAEILRGAETLLQSGSVSLLMIEFNEHNLRRQGSSTKGLWEQIETLGFSLSRFSPGSRQLVPAVYEGEIWYENLFACRDAEAINLRLGQAPTGNVEVANDLLQRAQACSQFKELEELNTYKEQAALAKSHQGWALRTEANLITCEGVKEELVKQLEQQAKQREALRFDLATSEGVRSELLKQQEEQAKQREALECDLVASERVRLELLKQQEEQAKQREALRFDLATSEGVRSELLKQLRQEADRTTNLTSAMATLATSLEQSRNRLAASDARLLLVIRALNAQREARGRAEAQLEVVGVSFFTRVAQWIGRI